MKSCLTLIEIWLICLIPCFSSALGALSYPAVGSDSLVSREYQLLMQIKGQEVTGLCIINIEADNHMLGTVVNEFGVKAFDFSFSNRKVKVFNVVAPLNKWYIKKMLRGDLRFILPHLEKRQNVVEKKRRLSVLPNGDIVIHNDQYSICYTFTPMVFAP